MMVVFRFTSTNSRFAAVKSIASVTHAGNLMKNNISETKLFHIASTQSGYFNAFQAKQALFSDGNHAYHVRVGNWIRGGSSMHCRLNILGVLMACLLAASGYTVAARPAYFPPATGTRWDTTGPAALGWCPARMDSLYNYLEAEGTRAFILLVDGRIVLERYFNGHTVTSNWYWASAGKTLTAFLVGLAQQDGYLSIADTSSKYLGQGWTACAPAQEERITIRHQLTMTTGLDDGVSSVDCTLDSCLVYKADPGTRWAYHNAPYTLLDSVLRAATGMTMNTYVSQKLKSVTGMNGAYVSPDYNNVFYSTARSMARFGLLVQNRGTWDTTPVMTDSVYFNDMINTSQNLNRSYGYLWWLNGKEGYMMPTLQTVFPGSMMPNAPADVHMALGKNGQFLNVAPSRNMVWVRMGDSPQSVPVPHLLNDAVWAYINRLDRSASIAGPGTAVPAVSGGPVHPFTSRISLKMPDSGGTCLLQDVAGRECWTGKNIARQDFGRLPRGIYFLHVLDGNTEQTYRLIKY